MKLLPFNFRPSPKDVLCKRGKTAFNHNKHFRELIRMNLEVYRKASKVERGMIVTNIVDTIEEGSPEGGFIRNVDDVWYQVEDDVAREKVGGAFREMMVGTKPKGCSKQSSLLTTPRNQQQQVERIK